MAKCITLTPLVKERFESASYGIVGNHSGVEICSWTKKALRNHGVCYKQKFYGIDCHRCAQISPALAWCQHACTYCWRPMEWMKEQVMKTEEVDDPEKIIEGCIAARKKLISGIGGACDVNKEQFYEAFMKFPSHWAISLSGEPTIYPRLDELIKLLKSREEVKSVFLVTNGQEPKMLQKLAKKKALPTQLYLSLSAPNEDLFKKINRPRSGASWRTLLRTIALLPKLKCRRVIRLTLIKNLNDCERLISQYAKLVEKSKTDFIEVKGYMWLGLSRKRLKECNMPFHEHVKEWSEKLAKALQHYSIVDEDERSRVMLFKRDNTKYDNMIKKSTKLQRTKEKNSTQSIYSSN